VIAKQAYHTMASLLENNMRCLKCMKVDPPLITKPMKDLPPLLAHLKDWCLCAGCIEQGVKETADKAAIYYRANKGHYKKLHVKYRKEGKSYYIKNILANKRKGSSLKAKDIPDELVEPQRQIMKMNKLIKEKENGR